MKTKLKKESKNTLGFAIFLIVAALWFGGLIYIGWTSRNDPPRKSLRKMVTEIHEITVKTEELK